jgi:hypothetical protein
MRRHLWVALRKFQRQGDYTFLIETAVWFGFAIRMALYLPIPGSVRLSDFFAISI